MKFKVNYFEYEILELDSHDERLKIDNDYHWGICSYKDRKIYINKDLNFINKKETLIHEVTHAFIEAYGFLQVNLTDEIVSDFVAAHIFNILRVINEYFKKEIIETL